MNRKMVLKLDRRMIFYVLCFMAYIRPEYLIRIGVIDQIYGLYRIGITALIFLLHLVKRKYNKFLGIWIVMESWIVIITILRGGEIFSAIVQCLSIISCLMLFQMYPQDIKRVLRSLLLVLEMYIYINLVTIILFPNGLYTTGVLNFATENWFLGFKNKHIIYYLPAMALTMIFGKIDGFNLRRTGLLVVIIGSALFVKSSTSIVALTIMLIIGLVPFVRRKYKIFNVYTYFGVSLMAFIIIPVLRLQYLFSFILVNVLGKSTDLTYRTNLWDVTFKAISEHFVSGWGQQSADVRHQMYNSQNIISAHNQLLEYLYIGGIVLLLLYILINIIICKRLWKVRDNQVIQIASAMYFALQVALIAEVYTDVLIYMIYFIAWQIVDICIDKREDVKFLNTKRRNSYEPRVQC